MADLRRLPPGTLPPIVLKFDASSLPVCLVTLKGEGMTETQLRDIGQYTVRNQLAVVSGRVGAAAVRRQVPPDHGLRRSGEARGVRVEPDGRRARGEQRQPDSAGRRREDRAVRLHPLHQQPVPRRSRTSTSCRSRPSARSTVTVGDIGRAEDGNQIQTNIVRVDGQPSVYLPMLKQGGDTNTIAVVDGVKETVGAAASTCRRSWSPTSSSISRCSSSARSRRWWTKGSIGLVLTALMVLVFLGSFRATIAVFLSIPLSALAAFIALYFGGSSINTMILAGLALVFSRLIDNAVIVLENIFRHLEMGEPPEVAAEKGGRGSGAGRAGGDADQLGRVLPGDVPVRRQPLSVLRAGARRRAVALRVVLRRDDRRAALLREADQGAAPPPPARTATRR